MKKIFTITLTIIVFIILMSLIGVYIKWQVNPLEDSDKIYLNFLNRIGNIFLSLVYVSYVTLFTLLIILAFYFSYCLVKLDFDAIKELKDLGLPTIIILGLISLLSIAGVQLRSLRNDN